MNKQLILFLQKKSSSTIHSLQFKGVVPDSDLALAVDLAVLDRLPPDLAVDCRVEARKIEIF